MPENKAKAPDSLVLPFAELKTGRPVDKEQYQLRPLGGNYFVLHLGSRFYENSLAQKPLTIAVDLSLFLVSDLLMLIYQSRRSGILVAAAPGFSKTVYINDGEVIMANSSLDDDRLGESLIRAGKLTQEQLDDCAKEITAENKLGKIMVERKLLTPKELWHGVKIQITEIVMTLFGIKEGTAFFFEGPVDLHNQVKLDKSMPDLIMQGIRLSADKDKLRSGMFNDDMVFKKGVSAHMSDSMSATEVDVFFLIDGFSSVGEIMELSKFSAEDVYATLARLSHKGLIELIGRKEAPGGGPPSAHGADPFADWKIGPANAGKNSRRAAGETGVRRKSGVRRNRRGGGIHPARRGAEDRDGLV